MLRYHYCSTYNNIIHKKKWLGSRDDKRKFQLYKLILISVQCSKTGKLANIKEMFEKEWGLNMHYLLRWCVWFMRWHWLKQQEVEKIGKKIVLVLEPLALMQIVFTTKPAFGNLNIFKVMKFNLSLSVFFSIVSDFSQQKLDALIFT